MRKETHNLNQTLDSIWRMGDRDEMSIKHIGHGLAAVIAFSDWTQAADYELPNYYLLSNDTVNKLANEHLRKIITPKWAKVQALKDRVGPDVFREIVAESKFGFYPLSYLKDSWLPYAAAGDLAATE